MAGITETDLVQALLEALERPQPTERPPGAMRTEEIQGALGISRIATKKILRIAKEQGLIRVCRIPHTDLLDRPTVVRGWQLVRSDTDET